MNSGTEVLLAEALIGNQNNEELKTACRIAAGLARPSVTKDFVV